MASGLQGDINSKTFQQVDRPTCTIPRDKRICIKIILYHGPYLNHVLQGIKSKSVIFKTFVFRGSWWPLGLNLEVKVCFRESTFLCNFLSAKSIIKVTVLKIALMLASFYFEFLINGFRKHLPVFFITCCQSVIITCLMSFQCWSLKAFWTIKSERIASFTNGAKQLRCVVKSQLRIFD